MSTSNTIPLGCPNSHDPCRSSSIFSWQKWERGKGNKCKLRLELKKHVGIIVMFSGNKIQVKHLDRSVLKKDRLSICSAIVDEQSPLHWTYLSKLGTIFSQTLGRNSKNPLARKMCAISDSILGYLNGCVCLPEVRILNGIRISNWGWNNKSGTETQNGEL